MTWWQNAAVYQIYPRSFCDSNGDLIGDLPGIQSKIEYLTELGIDAIWISPFYPSPLIDGGYDISDPRNVAEQLGGLAAFDELVQTADSQGIKVIIDLVPNHFSSQHKWFLEALNCPPGGNARSRFHFQNGKGEHGELPPNNWISLFGGPAWTQTNEVDGKPGQWYLHLFDKSQPDLNWTNPEVSSDFEQTIRFWLDRGVSGFRVDVALGLFKDMSYADDPNPQGRVDAIRLDLYDPSDRQTSEQTRRHLIESPIFDRDEVHDVYQNWQKIFQEYSQEILGVAEAWAYPTSRAMRYAKSLGQVFNFDFMVMPFNDQVLCDSIKQILKDSLSYETSPTWVLSNHDASRVVSRYGGGEVGLTKARSMALLAHFLPGSIYVYQGEELGLEDVHIAPEQRKDPIWINSDRTQIGREGARAPIPWQLVESQKAEPLSTLKMYQSLLHLRKTRAEWLGGIEATDVKSNAGLLTVTRDLLKCLVNLTNSQMSIPVSDRTQVLIHSSQRSDVSISSEQLNLPANTAAILEFSV